MKEHGRLDENCYRFLLTGGVAIGDDPDENPAQEWLPDKSWAELGRAMLLGENHELNNLRHDFQGGILVLLGFFSL